jgi:hypothetical protein
MLPGCDPRWSMLSSSSSTLSLYMLALRSWFSVSSFQYHLTLLYNHYTTLRCLPYSPGKLIPFFCFAVTTKLPPNKAPPKCATKSSNVIQYADAYTTSMPSTRVLLMANVDIQYKRRRYSWATPAVAMVATDPNSPTMLVYCQILDTKAVHSRQPR